jgi:nitrite reductase/ring-hydroxylating ferredoxin subunit
MSGRLNIEDFMTNGRYEVLDDYALRTEMYEKVVRTFLDGVEKLEGSQARERVQAEGLRNIHRHLPIEKVPELETFFLERMREELYYWTFRVGADDLGLPHPFYVDDLIMVRVHYPHLRARKAKKLAEPAYSRSELWRLAKTALKNPRFLAKHAGRRGAEFLTPRARPQQFNAVAYHGELPTAARAHGPHIDTWYGHSYDGLNLWWAIDGVNHDNTVILYPDMWGRPMNFDPVSMYIAPGYPLTKPLKIAFRPGQLLVFNPEMLHATQVNVSDETRVALTTRVNPKTPRFAPQAPFHRELWLSSTDLEKRRKRTSLTVFLSSRHEGKPSIPKHPPRTDTKTTRLQKAVDLPRDGEVAVCPASLVVPGEKLGVDLNNAKLVLFREGGRIAAYSRVCPHLGVDLIDGFHDGERVYCPGHGLEFTWKNGRSQCDAFRLRAFSASERDGTIYLARPRVVADKAPDGESDEVPTAASGVSA